jgi:hypothetical protein
MKYMEYIDNNIFLYVISFLILYSFILYVRINKYENILYFAIIYVIFYYYFKNINLSLLATYLLSLVIFSRNIMEGLAILDNYKQDIPSRINQLQENIQQVYNITKDQISAFQQKYNDPNVDFNKAQFENEKNQLLTSVNANINSMNNAFSELLQLTKTGHSNVASEIQANVVALQGNEQEVNTLLSSYENSLEAINTSIQTYINTYPAQLEDVTLESIFCKGPGPTNIVSQPAPITTTPVATIPVTTPKLPIPYMYRK